MAQDIKKLFEAQRNVSHNTMPEGHEARFLSKLEEKLPEQPKNKWSWLQIAASLLLLLGLGFGVFKMLNKQDKNIPTQMVETPKKTLEDVAPELKKVEDYYVASINFELSKLKPTPETKELFDGYLQRLAELNNEYNLLADELVKSGPDALTVDALISNLKLRLNLMQRLKEKLNELNSNSRSII